MKTIKNGMMIGTLGALLLSGCSSFDAQRFACLPKDHSPKDASTKKKRNTRLRAFLTLILLV